MTTSASWLCPPAKTITAGEHPEHQAPHVTDLGARVVAVLRALPALGRLTIETANASATIESHAEYHPFRIDGDIGRVDVDGLQLRLRTSGWTRARAIQEHGAVPMRTIEFTDAMGCVLHRVRLAEPGRAVDFEAVVAMLAGETGPLARGSQTTLPPLPPLRRLIRAAPQEVDRRDVRAAWYSLVGVGDGAALVRHLGVTRGRVLQSVGAAWARPVTADALPRMLEAAAVRGIGVAITVGNDGCTHSCAGPWQIEGLARTVLALKSAHGRVLVHDKPGNACWIVREPRPSTSAWCLEAHDPSGDLVLCVDVADARDQPMAAAWAELLAREPEVPLELLDGDA